MTLKDAVRAFAEASPPGLFDRSFLAALHQRSAAFCPPYRTILKHACLAPPFTTFSFETSLLPRRPPPRRNCPMHCHVRRAVRAPHPPGLGIIDRYRVKMPKGLNLPAIPSWKSLKDMERKVPPGLHHALSHLVFTLASLALYPQRSKQHPPLTLERLQEHARSGPVDAGKPRGTVVVMRGLPGSGKSTFVQKVFGGAQTVVCSADAYFTKEGGGWVLRPLIRTSTPGIVSISPVTQNCAKYSLIVHMPLMPPPATTRP